MIVTTSRDSFPLREPFAISRGVKTAAEVLTVTIASDGLTGRAECVPYARYGESMASVEDQMQQVSAACGDHLDAEELQEMLPAGAARNGLDCALWDMRAKKEGRRAWEIAGIPAPEFTPTCQTVGLASPETMAAKATPYRDWPMLKLKLDGEDVLERVAAVHAAAPNASLVIDANEAWTMALLTRMASALAGCGVVAIEQPLPADKDAALEGLTFPFHICADESLHTRADLDRLVSRYSMANIKLDKAGGLTEALALREACLTRGMAVMVGCMVATSLGIAPAMMLVRDAIVVDLDGPWWIASDREPALPIDDFRVGPPSSELWG